MLFATPTPIKARIQGVSCVVIRGNLRSDGFYLQIRITGTKSATYFKGQIHWKPERDIHPAKSDGPAFPGFWQICMKEET